MYVITFYSFKGGVGRTMALVNVAAELVRRGRKVLVVDFDLEAPGLETYEQLKPPRPHPGIVEYVAEYRRTNAVPNLLDYIYETKPIGKKGGRLWLMPAGRRDPAYRNALSQLDWQRLYKHEQGFLLFEETKVAWEQELQPDYVLIDSRTGDTDVLGICTRQLPDSVVVMFTPNEQNLTGLEPVVRDIRREATQGLKKSIHLHFVAANVPDVDDECRVLSRHLKTFCERLEFRELAAMIKRYESSNLLDQRVFTLNRPYTRLARSYRRLMRVLLKDNLSDRDGALLFLEDYPKLVHTRSERSGEKGSLVWSTGRGGDSEYSNRTGEVAKLDRSRLHTIGQRFHNDPNLLRKVADCFLADSALKSACHVFDRVVELDENDAHSLYQRATCKVIQGDVDGAAADLLASYRVWRSSGRAIHIPLHRANGIRWTPTGAALEALAHGQTCLRAFCRIAPPGKLQALSEILAAGEVEGIELAITIDDLCRREEGIPIARQFLRDSVERESSDALQGLAMAQLDGLVAADEFPTGTPDFTPYLKARCWNEVIQWHVDHRGESTSGIVLFHVALAHWGERGDLPESLCRHALEDFERSDDDHRRILFRNWKWDGLALLFWRVGEKAEATKAREQAEQEARANIMAEEEDVFSLWRFHLVSVREYLDDCILWRRLFEGEPLRPAFLGPANVVKDQTS